MARHFVTILLVIVVTVCGSLSATTSMIRNTHGSHYVKRAFDSTTYGHLPEQNKAQTVCETKECQTMARMFKENMNETVDPCMNFYYYACGNWGKNNPIPKGRTDWNVLEMIQKEVAKQIEGILKEESQPDDILPLKLARKLYKSCMNLDDIERRGLEPIVLTVARSGGWPMMSEPEEYNERKLHWQKVDDYYIHLLGEPTFFGLDIRPRESDGSVNMPYLVAPKEAMGASLNAPNCEMTHSKERRVENIRHENKAKKPYTSTEKKEKYREFITTVVVEIAEARGFPVSAGTIAKDVDDLMTFIAEMQQCRTLSKSETNMTMTEFQDWYDGLGYSSEAAQINWIRKLSILFDNANVNVDENLLMRIYHMEYIEELARLLNKTTPRTIVNYVQWKAVSRLLDATTKRMRMLNNDLMKFSRPFRRSEREEEEKDEMQKRSAYCLKNMELDTIVGSEYVKRNFDKSVIATAEGMISNIKNEIEKQIIKSDWMSSGTKTHALTKLKKMNVKFGYPKWYDNKTLVNDFYKGVVVSPFYFDNVINFAKRENWNKLKALTKTIKNVDGNKGVEPIDINASYRQNTNMIVRTASDLHERLFHPSRPAMVNLGILGLNIAHGFNLAFDFYSSGANVREEELSNIDAHRSRVACFAEQHNKYVLETGLADTTRSYGNGTFNEHFADSLGLIVAYHAYKNRERENGRPESTLPGFENFNNDQLFFLSLANLFCEANLEKEIEQKYKRDLYAPPIFRLRSSLSNSEEFAIAYNCPVGSFMNPEKKCSIWK